MGTVRLLDFYGLAGGGTVRLTNFYAVNPSHGVVRLTDFFSKTTSTDVVTIDVGAPGDYRGGKIAILIFDSSVPVTWSIVQTGGPQVVLVGGAGIYQYLTPQVLEGATVTFQITGTTAGGAIATATLTDNIRAYSGPWKYVGNTRVPGIFRRPIIEPIEITPGLDPKQLALLNAFNSSATTPLNLAYTGSSTTAGNNATTAANRYVNLLSGLLRTKYGSLGDTAALNATSIPSTPGIWARNGGVGGTTSQNYIDASRHGFIAAMKPRIVIHMVSSNDFAFNVNPATYKTNVLAAINAIDAEVPNQVLHVLVNSYQRMDVASPAFTWQSYADKMVEIAASKSNVSYIDLNPIYVAIGIPGADPLNYLDTDLIHQTNAGHAFMAQKLFEILTAPA